MERQVFSGNQVKLLVVLPDKYELVCLIRELPQEKLKILDEDSGPTCMVGADLVSKWDYFEQRS
jgi:hypothetical protein